MGCYTRFELEIYWGNDCITDYEEVITEYIGYSPFDGSTKWDDFEKEMKEISKLHPKVVFELSGEGEEAGDLWKAYFKDGKMQMCRAKIGYDDFDEILLQ